MACSVGLGATSQLSVQASSNPNQANIADVQGKMGNKPTKNNPNNSDINDTSSNPTPAPMSTSSMRTWKQGKVPANLKKYIHDPQDAGLQYGNGLGWSDPGGECVNFANSYFTSIWNITGHKYVIGNGINMASAWSHTIRGHKSNQPQVGSIASTSQSALTGGNPAGHTYIVEHIFTDGSLLVAEENWPSASGSGDDIGKANTWNYALLPHKLVASGTQFFTPNTHEYHLNWNNSNDSF